MTRWMLALGFVFAVSLAGAATASAQGFGGGYGWAPHGGIGYSAGYAPGMSLGYGAGYPGVGYGGSGIGLSVGGPNFGFSYNSVPRIYPQPHWDYHPATLRRHGNHYHVTPGHYDLHVPGRRPHHHH